MEKNKKNAKTQNKKRKNTTKMNPFDNFLFNVFSKIAKKWDDEEHAKLKNEKCPEGVTEIKDIFYAGDKNKSHTLDVYFKQSGKNFPILIDIHGGAFVSGSKFSDRLFCFTMADEGLLVFNVNYTLALKKASVFDEIHEIHTAVSWILAHASEYGGDLSKIYFSGHSAGAILAVVETLTNLDENMRQLFELQKLNYTISGLLINCGFMGFYQNILPYQMLRKVIFPAKAEKTEKFKSLIFSKNPSLKLLPKTFLVTNSKDEIKYMTVGFKKLLDKVGVENEISTESEGGHVGLIYIRSQKNLDVIKRALEFLEVLN